MKLSLIWMQTMPSTSRHSHIPLCPMQTFERYYVIENLLNKYLSVRQRERDLKAEGATWNIANTHIEMKWTTTSLSPNVMLHLPFIHFCCFHVSLFLSSDFHAWNATNLIENSIYLLENSAYILSTNAHSRGA